MGCHYTVNGVPHKHNRDVFLVSLTQLLEIAGVNPPAKVTYRDRPDGTWMDFPENGLLDLDDGVEVLVTR
jgi:hypothetical protein